MSRTFKGVVDMEALHALGKLMQLSKLMVSSCVE